MTNDDDSNEVQVHYGDKIVTVGERFDRLEKIQVVEGIGILLLVGIHIPEVGPLLEVLAKIVIH